MPHRPSRIISGGQTGADQGALAAALGLGIARGGTAPRGYLTEAGGAARLLRDVHGLAEGPPGYAARTEINVRDADATLVVARNPTSRGTALTVGVAKKLGRPCLVVDLKAQHRHVVRAVRAWLDEHRPLTLNVAGNRESVAPGIQQLTEDLLREVLS